MPDDNDGSGQLLRGNFSVHQPIDLGELRRVHPNRLRGSDR